MPRLQHAVNGEAVEIDEDRDAQGRAAAVADESDDVENVPQQERDQSEQEGVGRVFQQDVPRGAEQQTNDDEPVESILMRQQKQIQGHHQHRDGLGDHLQPKNVDHPARDEDSRGDHTDGNEDFCAGGDGAAFGHEGLSVG